MKNEVKSVNDINIETYYIEASLRWLKMKRQKERHKVQGFSEYGYY